MKKDIKTINEIIKVIGKSQVTEITIEEKDFNLFIKKPKLVLDTTNEEIIEEEIQEEVEVESSNIKDIISETVGRFYYVDKNELPIIEVGMTVTKGQPVGYIKSIGIITEIKSDFQGEIVEIPVKNGEIAEYGKVLVKIAE